MPAKPKPEPKAKTKKRKKKTPRQLMIRNLDTLAREVVFYRDPNSVPLSYKASLDEQGAVEYAVNHSGVPQPGHIISRAKMAVRWDLRNLHKQDMSDNLLHEYYPEVYITWYINTFGLVSWKELVADSRQIQKYTMDDLETLHFKLTEVQKWQEATGKKAYFTQWQILNGEWK
jgi:hypothetical protein